MNFQIAVVTHKEYPICKDELYLPLMAGSIGMSEADTVGYARDDSGDNISEKNGKYCELTGLYWMWKNSDADCIGLCHYRRYFGHSRNGILVKNERTAGYSHGRKDNVNSKYSSTVKAGSIHSRTAEFSGVIKSNEVADLMDRYQVVLPAPRNYYIETNYSQFAHSHGAIALDVTREIIQERHPEYIEAYDMRMAMRRGHRFNMFIMHRNLCDEYCTWLFDILFELEKRIGNSQLDDNRLYGHVAERLLDVWIDMTGYSNIELPYVFTEKEHLISKASAMVLRKVRANRQSL